MSDQSSAIPEATPEQLAHALKQLQEGKGTGDFKMTKEEASKIEVPNSPIPSRCHCPTQRLWRPLWLPPVAARPDACDGIRV